MIDILFLGMLMDNESGAAERPDAYADAVDDHQSIVSDEQSEGRAASPTSTSQYVNVASSDDDAARLFVYRYEN